MHLLFLNWRDLKNPRSGGAEVVTEEVMKHLVTRGHTCTLFTARFPGCASEEVVHGYTVIRRGSEYTVHLHACYQWFKRFRREQFDAVIDQIHGIPFFTPLYVRKVQVIAFIHEVARDIWLRMYRFPIGRIGYTLEPLFYLAYRTTPFLTVSHATARDLVRMRIPESRIALIPEAITIKPIDRPPHKDIQPTVLFVGRIAKMKGVHHLIEAYHIARSHMPELRLWLVGGGDAYKAELEQRYAHDPLITFFGFVDEAKKLELLERASVLGSASMKEGYGLVVIEAAARGTPSVVYNVQGFNEAVVDGVTGTLTLTDPTSLAQGITSLLRNPELYSRMQQAAHARSKEFTFEHTTDVFETLVQERVATAHDAKTNDMVQIRQH